MSLIFESNRNEKPIWTILKEIKDTIPVFIETHILKVLALKYDPSRINIIKRRIPKKSLMNCRFLLITLITSIESENLIADYVKALILIINHSKNESTIFTRYSKNWSTLVKTKLLALMLFVYQFSIEK